MIKGSGGEFADCSIERRVYYVNWVREREREANTDANVRRRLCKILLQCKKKVRYIIRRCNAREICVSAY